MQPVTGAKVNFLTFLGTPYRGFSDCLEKKKMKKKIFG
jgi:hypothetical protein